MRTIKWQWRQRKATISFYLTQRKCSQTTERNNMEVSFQRATVFNGINTSALLFKFSFFPLCFLAGSSGNTHVHYYWGCSSKTGLNLWCPRGTAEPSDFDGSQLHLKPSRERLVCLRQRDSTHLIFFCSDEIIFLINLDNTSRHKGLSTRRWKYIFKWTFHSYPCFLVVNREI